MSCQFIIYVATNNVNGKRYVGMTSMALRRRVQSHLQVAAKGSQTILHNAIRKHGADAFTFEHVASAQCREDMQAVERAMIEQEGTMYPAGYNMTPGGDGFHGRRRRSSVEQGAAKIRAAHAARTPEEKAAWAAKISAAKKGKSQPWAREIGKYNKGRVRSEEFKAKVSAGMKRYRNRDNMVDNLAPLL